MRQPAFWHRQPGLAAWLLSPLGCVYAGAVKRRVAAGSRRLVGIPVICIGNINVGGTGKTPLAIALGERLLARGESPHFVSRGYRGKANRLIRVDPNRDSPVLTGDEPRLLAAIAPTWVAPDRAEAAAAAKDAGASVVILDDGHQDAALAYDFSVIVADADRGFGNGMVLPAGPLREPAPAGMKRADLLIAVGSQKAQDAFLKKWGGVIACPVARASLNPLTAGADWSGMRVVAFAGIGHPTKFFDTIRALDAQIVQEVPLDDHQRPGEKLLRRLAATAASLDATLVTTEKDAARLPQAWRSRVLSLPVRMQINEWPAIDLQLERVLAGGHGHSAKASSRRSASC